MQASVGEPYRPNNAVCFLVAVGLSFNTLCITLFMKFCDRWILIPELTIGQ